MRESPRREAVDRIRNQSEPADERLVAPSSEEPTRELDEASSKDSLPDEAGPVPATSADPDLTYRVYELSDLEARSASRAPAPARPTSTREGIKRATLDSMTVAIAWSRGPRCEGLVDTMRPPLAVLWSELRRLPGRTIAWRMAMILGGVIALLGIVLVLADVTDDLPVRASTATSALAAAEDGAPSPAPSEAAPPPVPPIVIQTPKRAEAPLVAPPPKRRGGAKQVVEIFVP